MKEDTLQVKKEANILPKAPKDKDKAAKKEAILNEDSEHPYDKKNSIKIKDINYTKN